MSGGSYNYICSRLEDECYGRMHDAELDDLMKDIPELAHDVEWYDSGDYGDETYRECVEKFKNKWFKQSRTDRLKGYVDKAIDDMRKELYKLLDVGIE